jgi:NADH-quinone oxidoreductase subunit N
MLRGGEMFTLAMFALLGIFVMISGNNFLVIYLGLELMTCRSYALVALRRDQRHRHRSGHEVLRAGRAGQRLPALRPVHAVRRHRHRWTSTRCSRPSHRGRSSTRCWCSAWCSSWPAWPSSWAVPFHMWVPDVYQGAPTAVTLLIGGAPKLAAFAITIRLLVEGLLPWPSTGSRC